MALQHREKLGFWCSVAKRTVSAVSERVGGVGSIVQAWVGVCHGCRHRPMGSGQPATSPTVTEARYCSSWAARFGGSQVSQELF